jgi:hypothetical protein
VLPGTTVKYTEVNSLSGSGAIRYAATQKGIYRSSDSGATWAQFSNAGLPFAETPVYEVRVDPNNSAVLYADTAAGTFVFGKNSPPNVNSVEVQGSAVAGGPVKLAVYGNYLDVNPLTLSLQDCANPTVLAGGDDMTQYLQCQMGSATGAKNGTVKDADGAVLNSFTVQVVPPIAQVTGVTPKTTPVVGKSVTFSIVGQVLNQPLSFNLPDCANLQEVPGGTATLREYSCTLGGQAGNRAGTIKDGGGRTIYTFNVAVIEPKVTEISPLTAIMGKTTEFTVHGVELPDNLTLWLGYCVNVQRLGGDASARRFSCEMNSPMGSRQDGKIVNAQNQAIFSFQVDVTGPIQEVTPLSAAAGERTIFTVKGVDLDENVAFYLPYCADVQDLGGDAQTRQYSCVMNAEAGSSHAGGILIQNVNNFPFEVSVVAPSQNQCAVYDPAASPQVSVPCVDVGGTLYSAGMNIVPGAPRLRFAVDMGSLQHLDATAGADCAAYPFGPQNRLRINCVEVAGAKVWAELDMSPNPAAIEFDLAAHGAR